MRVVSAVVAMLVLAASPARAGVNLFWENCGSEGGIVLETFACDINTGAHTLVASFVSEADFPQLVGFEAVVDLCSMGNPFPDWWQFQADGSCRQSALTASADFSNSPGLNCHDLWGGGGGPTLLSYVVSPGSWNKARAVVTYFPLQLSDIMAGTEYYGFKLRVANTNTIGTDACTGCTIPICFVLNQIRLISSNSTTDLTSPDMNYAAHWQQTVPGCPFIVPAANRTWGQVKSLYR
jgi:hypothetical protein